MIIQSKNVWINEEFVAKQLVIENGIIVSINEYDCQNADKDYGDNWILPGFIDIHTHGYNNAFANRPTFDQMQMWCNHMPKEGVTSFMATTCTQPHQNNLTAMVGLADYIESSYTGSEVLGINIEGNFISLDCPGAQDVSSIVKPDPEVLQQYYDLSRGHVMYVTYACENDDNFAFLDKCLQLGVVASIGHANPSFQQANEAIAHGAKAITHTGNGMKPFHHRNPGLFGAALLNNDVCCEAIGDGAHINFATAELIGRMKGKDKMCLITDSAVEKDDPQYDYMLHNGAYSYENGTLFGSALYVNDGVKNLIYKANLPIVTAINAATINPARLMGVDNRKGSLEVNKDADIVVCDENIRLVDVYCRGESQL